MPLWQRGCSGCHERSRDVQDFSARECHQSCCKWASCSSQQPYTSNSSCLLLCYICFYSRRRHLAYFRTTDRTLVWYQTRMVARSFTSSCPTTSVETSWTPSRPICCTTPTFPSQTCSGSLEAFATVSEHFTATACPMYRLVLGNRRRPTRESKYGNHAQACDDRDQPCRLQDRKAQDCRT